MILRTDDVERQDDIFTSNFIGCLDACAPYVTKEIKRPFAPWMNTRLQEAMKLGMRDGIRKQLKFDRYNVALQEHYKHEKKQVKTFIAESKAEHYFNKIHENRGIAAKTWITIREIVPDSKSNARNCSFDDEVNKANGFNVHFANVGKNTYEKNSGNTPWWKCTVF